jgi:phage major head subunit gpT-like protein
MNINTGTLTSLDQAVQMMFNRGLERAVTPWDFLAMTIPSTTAENVYPYLTELGFIREWVGDREIQNLQNGDFKITNKAFEETHGVPRPTIADDSYGLYGPMFEQTGQNVASFPAEQVYSTLAAGFTTLGPDGQYFFDTDHPVGGGVASNHMGGAGTAWYLIDASKVFKPVIWQPRQAFDLVRLFNPTDQSVFMQNKFLWGVDGRSGVGYSPFWQLAFGSKQTLDATNLKAAIVAMGSQKGPSGKPLKVMGTHLVVPPSLSELAADLINKDRLANGESNTLKGRLQLVVVPELG